MKVWIGRGWGGEGEEEERVKERRCKPHSRPLSYHTTLPGRRPTKEALTTKEGPLPGRLHLTASLPAPVLSRMRRVLEWLRAKLAALRQLLADLDLCNLAFVAPGTHTVRRTRSGHYKRLD